MIAVCLLLSIALATAQETQRYAWNGEVRLAKGSTSGPSYEASAPAIESELAGIEVDLQLDRDFARALRKLDGLQARASRVQVFAGQGDVITRVALQRSQVFHMQGKLDEARQALQRLLPRSAKVVDELDSEFTCVPAPKRLLDIEQSLLQDARLVEARSALDATAGTSVDPQEPADLESILRNALLNGEADVAVEIGQRAAPVLERILSADLDDYPDDSGHDALTALMEVSSARAAEFVQKNYGYAGFFWKKRVLRSMRAAHVLADYRAWLDVGPNWTDVAPRFLGLGWCDVLAHYALDPDVAAEALQQAAYLAQRDALTPALQRSLIAGWQSASPEVFEQVRRIASEARGQPSLAAVLEAGLEHSLPEVRAVCADLLTHYVRSAGLRHSVDNPDAAVRKALADSLGDRDLNVRTYAGNGAEIRVNERTKSLEPIVDGQDVALFDRLLVDASEDVRVAAVRALRTRSDVRPSLDSLLALASDRNAAVRRESVDLLGWNEEQAPSVLEKLARDRDPSVLFEVDAYFADRTEAKDDAVVQARFARYSAALLARLDNDAAPLGRGMETRHRTNILGCALAAPMRFLAPASEIALEKGDDELLENLVLLTPDPDPSQSGESFEALAPELLAKVFARVFALQNPGTFKRFREKLMKDAAPFAPGLLLVVRSDAHSRSLRIAAGSLLASSLRPGDREALHAFLRSAAWKDGPPDAKEAGYLSTAGYRLGSAIDGAPVLASWIADEALPSEVRQQLARSLSDEALENRSLALAVVRHVDAVANAETMENTLEQFSVTLEEEDAERLRALGWLGGNVGEEAIGYFGRVRDPRYFPWVVEWLNLDGAGDNETRIRRAAADAISCYLNDEAAEALLAAAGRTGDYAIREHLFANLEVIRKYQDQVALWRTRQAGSQARENAIVELLPMLEDPEGEVRAQAALGLATLGAVEQLPKIVHLLKDPKNEVRAAAKQALESMHRQEEARRQSQPPTEGEKDQ